MRGVRWMSSVAGRLTRIGAGVALIVVGLAAGGGWRLVSALGVVPLLAGVLDVCLFAPLMKQPLRGRDARS
jgi:hypothetical protein